MPPSQAAERTAMQIIDLLQGGAGVAGPGAAQSLEKSMVEIRDLLPAALAGEVSHDELHAPETHIGQGATAAELEELTDGSESLLHSHAAAAAGPVIVEKTADETVNDSTTLQDDDELFFTMAPDKRYLVEVLPLTNGSAVADFEFDITVPGTSVFEYYYNLNGTTGAHIVAQAQDDSAHEVAGFGADAIPMWIMGIAIADETGGALQVRWAQNVAEVSDSKVLTGSIIRYTLLN